jgi:hypothetical protein
MSIKNKELKMMNEEWREAVLPANCYFCYFLGFEFTSVQVYKSSSMLVNLNS